MLKTIRRDRRWKAVVFLKFAQHRKCVYSSSPFSKARLSDLKGDGDAQKSKYPVVSLWGRRSAGGLPAPLLLLFAHNLSSRFPGRLDLDAGDCWGRFPVLSVKRSSVGAALVFTRMEREAVLICSKWLVRRCQMELLRCYFQVGL